MHMDTSGHFQCGLCNLRETDGMMSKIMTLKEFIENQFSILSDEDAGNLDKVLKFFVLFTYGVTAPQFQKYIILIINTFFPNSFQNGELYLNTMALILTIAIYFLLNHISGDIRSFAYTVRSDIWILISNILGIKSSKYNIFDDYRDDVSLVLASEVRKYLDINEDERIKEKYKSYHNFVYYLMQRKNNAMMIAILLSINFYINYNILIDYSKLYLMVVIFFALWSTFIPENEVTFMRIYGNKIRVKKSLVDSNYPPIQ
jgi:hypothetical protein